MIEQGATFAHRGQCSAPAPEGYISVQSCITVLQSKTPPKIKQIQLGHLHDSGTGFTKRGGCDDRRVLIVYISLNEF